MELPLPCRVRVLPVAAQRRACNSVEHVEPAAQVATALRTASHPRHHRPPHDAPAGSETVTAWGPVLTRLPKKSLTPASAAAADRYPGAARHSSRSRPGRTAQAKSAHAGTD